MQKDTKRKKKLTVEEENKLWREFWVNKLGHYPTKIEKVVRKVSFEEFNKEKGELYKEFEEFVNSRK